MVAGPLIPPRPGLVPAAGPPRRLRALWATVEFGTPAELAAALGRLDPALAAPDLRHALIQVHYTPATLSTEAARHHLDFARRHPRASTWLPFCLPGSPEYGRLGPLATPEDCHGCLFYEALACQGLGGDPVPWSARRGAEPALRPVDRAVERFRRADFGAAEPVAYWMPERRQVATIAAAVRIAGGTLWDLGGGNGFIAALLAREGLAVTVIDRVPHYSTPPGVSRIVGDVRDPWPDPPDALLISWPPTGDGFRDVVRRLRPKVVVYAYDADGYCGRRAGHAGVVARAEGLSWFRYPVDDFAPLPGLRRRAAWSVACHHDLRRDARTRSGRLEIRAGFDLPPVPAVEPYPWEQPASEAPDQVERHR